MLPEIIKSTSGKFLIKLRAECPKRYPRNSVKPRAACSLLCQNWASFELTSTGTIRKSSGTCQDTDRENQERIVDRSKNDPHPEVDVTANSSPHTVVSDHDAELHNKISKVLNSLSENSQIKQK